MSKVTVDDTVTSIVSSNSNRKKLWIKNIGVNTVFIGDNTVTASSGFPVFAGEEFVSSDYSGEWSGICEASESTDVSVFEEVVE